MPRVTAYRLAWSGSDQTYQLQQTRDHTTFDLVPDSPAWFGWLEQVASFSFVGQRGHLTASKQSRAASGAYWYAYRGTGRQLRKQYLGKSAGLTLARLEKVAERLAAQGPALTAAEEAPARALRASSPLPLPLTSLLGREREVAAAVTLLMRPEVRLLTLTGTAGVGKTRLALAIASELGRSFSDGITFVSLGPLADHGLVLPTIAQALGLPASRARAPLEVLKIAVHERQVLLVLDNFEQVVEAAPSLVDLLAACPHLKLLVTSREVLRVRGEREFPLLPLALPDPQHLPDLPTLARYGAVALFLERAREVVPSFELSPLTAPVVVEVCRRLDGLPLAIELAAARLNLLSLPALLGRLEHRLVVLTGGPRDLPERQHTLRATLAWSYDLLSPDEQRLFRRISVFVGGCTLEAVEAALGDKDVQVLDGVASLLDKHLLLRADPDGSRLQMLETLREYGMELLTTQGEQEAVRQAHAQCYLALAEAAETHLFSPEQQQWVDRLQQEHDNLRVALQWSLEPEETGRRREVAWRLAGALQWFWANYGYGREGQQFVERILQSDEGISAPVRAKALSGAGWLAIWQGDYVRAQELCEASLELYRGLHDTSRMTGVLYRLGWIATSRGDAFLATSRFEESLTLARDAGDKDRLAFSLTALALTSLRFADRSIYPKVDALLVESLALFRQEHYQAGIGWCLYCLGLLRIQQHESATARVLLEESLALFSASGQRQYILQVLYYLAKARAQEGDYPAAHLRFQECMRLCRELDDRGSAAACLESWAGMVALQGYPTWAAQLWGAAQALRTVAGSSDFFSLFTLPGEDAEEERMRTRVRGELGEAAFAQALAEGRALTPEQALAAAEHPLVTLPSPASPTADRLPKPVSATSADLTEREMEVLRLVAQGLTDPQVADLLVISPRTVNAHLRSIYSKLGISSRHAATLFALKQHLI